MAPAENAEEALRHDGGPAAQTDMGDEGEDRIRLDDDPRLDDAGITEETVDDAPILHIRRQQAERDLGDLVPADLLAIIERPAGLCEEHIALTIDREAANVLQRLVPRLRPA